MAMSPTVMKVMPKPWSGFGTSQYCIFSLTAPMETMASVHPSPDPKRIGDGIPYGADILCACGVEPYALLHEERRTHDGAVDGDKWQEDAEGTVERWRILLDSHLDNLCYTGDDGNEEDETKV